MTKKSIITRLILFLLPILLLSLIITFSFKNKTTWPKPVIVNEVIEVTQKEAILKTGKFCKQFQLNCQQLNIIDHYPLGNVGAVPEYYQKHYFWADTYKPFGLYVSAVVKGGAFEEGRDSVYFVVGGKSREIEFYQNKAIYWMRYKENYSREMNRVKWPEFMDENKAKERLTLLAAKLNIPKDMKFEKMVRDDLHGLWGGIWLRKKNDYLYEGDAVTVSVMGATGEFISYTITYRGVPCSTEIKVSREHALNLGWAKLRESVPRKIKNNIEEAYSVAAKLLIVQTNRLGNSSVPVQVDGSKLAWVVSYAFRGGVKYPYDVSLREDEMTKEQKAVLARYYAEYQDKWEDMGRPEETFEVRIDAATGEVLYVSPVRSWCKKWRLK